MQTLTEIFAEPKVGKTYQAHSGWPNPIHLDFASARLEFGDYSIPDEETTGDAWPTVFMDCHDGSQDDARDHYQYVSSYGSLMELTGEVSEYDTVIMDDTVQLKALATIDYVEQKGGEWLTQREYGNVYGKVRQAIEAFRHTHHVVLISRMQDEWQNDQRTGRRTPKSGLKDPDYECDWRVRLAIEDGERVATITENRFADKAATGPETDLGDSVSLDDLALVSGLPTEVLRDQ